VAVLGQPVEVDDVQLVSKRLHHLDGNRHRIVEEGPQVPDGRQLQGESKTVVLATATSDLAKVVIAQMKEAAQLVGCR
jgi:hypothetical protein